MTLDPDGVLHGTPTEIGSSLIFPVVTDSAGSPNVLRINLALTFVVTPAATPEPLTFNPHFDLPDATLTFTNRAFAEFFGSTSDDLSGAKLVDLRPAYGRRRPRPARDSLRRTSRAAPKSRGALHLRPCIVRPRVLLLFSIGEAESRQRFADLVCPAHCRAVPRHLTA